MADYTVAKSSKLKLKGEKVKKHKKRKAKNVDDSNDSQKYQEEQDTIKHGGWWAATGFEEITGAIAFEFGTQTYMRSLDDGTFTLGPPHDEADAPSPEEIFTAIRINDDKIAIKSGYGKYLRIDKNNELIGRSDAVGPSEQFEPIFDDGKLALLGFNACFLSVHPETDAIIATSRKAGSGEYLQLRCQIERNLKKDERPVEEQSANVRQIEINYVKKFQKFQDKRMRVADGDREEVKKARVEGTLHETLLDRRSKMKADRYCK